MLKKGFIYLIWINILKKFYIGEIIIVNNIENSCGFWIFVNWYVEFVYVIYVNISIL